MFCGEAFSQYPKTGSEQLLHYATRCSGGELTRWFLLDSVRVRGRWRWLGGGMDGGGREGGDLGLMYLTGFL